MDAVVAATAQTATVEDGRSSVSQIFSSTKCAAFGFCCMMGRREPDEGEIRARVEVGHPRWHDQSINRPFTCEHCGEPGHAGEADARCEECGKTTYLWIEVIMEREEYEEYEEEYGHLQE